jgi:iron(III) transport system ATP-binding protein
MSHVRIEGLTKRFAGKPPAVAVDDLSLEIASGEFVVLLGPSGCGKTTTLRCLAGLETPDEGRISLGEKTVLDSRSKTNLPPNKRNIGMVFQSYALWPHMTVRKNIGYPLRARRVERARARQWIEETAQLVDCGGLLDRYPGQLSGGQQQRVALARGLVARPDLVLFDEPLSNLDARLRDQVRAPLH